MIAAGVGAITILVIAGGFAVAQLLFGDKIALASMRAKVTTPEEQPELHAMIERLCQLADLPKPRVAVSEMDLPNAFAAGHSRKTATVCVTTGLVERLEPRELEGVIAHELSHVANKDVIVMTVAGFLATVAGLFVRFGDLQRHERRGAAATTAPPCSSSSSWSRWWCTWCRSCCCGRSRATASSRPTAARRS